MPFVRDPLAERYDATTAQLAGRALAARGRWVYVAVPRLSRRTAGATVMAWLAEHGLRLDAVDSGGLTTWERAYQRSLYWTFNGGGTGIRGGTGRNEVWSLQREWGPVTPAGRMLGVRVTPVDTARRAAARKPRADQWKRNPALESGGDGSGRERF